MGKFLNFYTQQPLFPIELTPNIIKRELIIPTESRNYIQPAKSKTKPDISERRFPSPCTWQPHYPPVPARKMPNCPGASLPCRSKLRSNNGPWIILAFLARAEVSAAVSDIPAGVTKFYAGEICINISGRLAYDEACGGIKTGSAGAVKWWDSSLQNPIMFWRGACGIVTVSYMERAGSLENKNLFDLVSRFMVRVKPTLV